MAKKLSLILAPEAEDALAKIYRYSEDQWGAKKALRYLSEIEAVFDLLCSNPKLGHTVHATLPHYLFFPINKHWIVYISDAKWLSIVAVIHQNMEISHQLENIITKNRMH